MYVGVRVVEVAELSMTLMVVLELGKATMLSAEAVGGVTVIDVELTNEGVTATELLPLVKFTVVFVVVAAELKLPASVMALGAVETLATTPTIGPAVLIVGLT